MCILPFNLFFIVYVNNCKKIASILWYTDGVSHGSTDTVAQVYPRLPIRHDLQTGNRQVKIEIKPGHSGERVWKVARSLYTNDFLCTFVLCSQYKFVSQLSSQKSLLQLSSFLYHFCIFFTNSVYLVLVLNMQEILPTGR